MNEKKEETKMSTATAEKVVKDEIIYYRILHDLNVQLGPSMISLPRGKILSSEADGHLIERLKTVYSGKTAPVKRMTIDELAASAAEKIGF